jgi:hypothetical protein
MTALPRNGCTGSGAAHPGCPAGCTGVLDDAGDVLPAGAPVLAEGVALALATGGPPGAVSRGA